MGSTRDLWRVQVGASPIASAPLTMGLQHHLRRDALTTVLMQIGHQQQAFVALTGCPGCRSGRCRLGCRVALLQRVLSASLGHDTPLVRSSQGLAPRPYRQAWLLWPGHAATVLDADSLAGWHEARLVLHWFPTALPRPALAVSGILLVDAHGPAVADRLAAYGWHARRIPRGAPLFSTTAPRALPLPVAYPGAPFLALPHTPAAPTHNPIQSHHGMALVDAAGGQRQGEPGDRLDETVKDWLIAIRDRRPLPNAPAAAPPPPVAPPTPQQDDDPRDPHVPLRTQQAANGADAIPVAVPDVVAVVAVEPGRAGEAEPISAVVEPVVVTPATAAPSAAPPVVWPTGPDPMTAADMAQLMACCLSSPVFVEGTRPGVSKNRLGTILPDDLRGCSAQLLVWFGRAGVLAPPPADDPWRNPRPLAVTDPGVLAAQLTATPIPTRDEALSAIRQQQR